MAKGSTKNFFVWIILGLLFVGLMGFGASGLSGNISSIGSVGEKSLPVQTYFNELQTQIAIRSSQIGRQMSFPEAEAEGLPIRALQSAVAERSLDNEAAVLGLSVGDDTISGQVLGNPSFRGGDGTFDQAQYREALARSGLSVREYETTLREGAARALLQGAVYTGMPDPETFGEAVAAFTREGRTFTWAHITEANVEVALGQPSDADLQAYYDANPASFTTPEVRMVRYVWLTPAMIQDDVPVDETELRAEYDARIDEFVVPERRLIERLVFGDEAEAQAALDAIAADETSFPELVADRGLTLDDVDAGDVSLAEMSGDAGQAIFASETGEVTGPFLTDLGPALFRMNAVLSARETTFEEALPILREDEAAARAGRIIEDQIDPIINLLAGGARLEDVAEQTDMELGEIEWSEDNSEGIAAYASFRELAAAQDVGDYAELTDLDDGGLFAIEVTEIRAPALIPLEDARVDAAAGWAIQATADAVLADAEAIAEELRTTVQDFGAFDLEAVQENAMTRRGFINGAPTSFLTEVFEMEIGEIRVIANGEDAIIVRLDDVSGADPSDEAYVAEVAAVAESAGEGIAQDVYELYGRAIQMQTDVQINDAAVNAVHANFR
ncbi:peptidyl-prolyl cis-trans isomerase [Octadecabacter sp. CECT 8868]|uniref:peptidylprolyl isomerase n=1 Tax=Octadecabacter algicola TaxID=2909342 RepID=UPI001F18CE09|nr:peptidyl-prolyl cis-trans isomerase [Octadecabacter algicola]MCF2903797.1 peptidyl-prolyl cis-trans isomerase [Octadecabacter algicola]